MKGSVITTKAVKVRYVREKLQLTKLELSKESRIYTMTFARWEKSIQEHRAKQWGKFLEFCERKNIIFGI